VLRDSDDLAGALGAASEAAYAAVPEPAEGTMLTLIRELAEEGGDLDALLARGEDCVARTQAMLPVLTEAGVVDAGAAGLLELFRGIVAALRGEPLPEPPTAAERPLPLEAIHLAPSRYRYCTGFVVQGEGLDQDTLAAELGKLGDSLLVVGDDRALKAHIHTDDPGRALGIGGARGRVSGVEIADMHEQARERRERLLAASPVATEVVAVASGDGNRRLFESLGARVLDGGPTMNPSTGDLLDAINATTGGQTVLLPNDRNVFLAAEAAAREAARPAFVLRTESIPAGLAALVAFDPAVNAEENLPRMRRAVASVASGAVAIASREMDSEDLTVRKGDWLGLVDGRPVVGGETFDEVALAVIEHLLAEPRDVLTLLIGADEPAVDALREQISATHPELEVEVHDGGQPHYALLISTE
jgi:DAK2 domain fusion protein YloV